MRDKQGRWHDPAEWQDALWAYITLIAEIVGILLVACLVVGLVLNLRDQRSRAVGYGKTSQEKVSIARRVLPTICDMPGPSLRYPGGRTRVPYCVLPAGHTGPHRSDAGVQWGERNE